MIFLRFPPFTWKVLEAQRDQTISPMSSSSQVPWWSFLLHTALPSSVSWFQALPWYPSLVPCSDSTSDICESHCMPRFLGFHLPPGFGLHLPGSFPTVWHVCRRLCLAPALSLIAMSLQSGAVSTQQTLLIDCVPWNCSHSLWCQEHISLNYCTKAIWGFHSCNSLI